MREQTFEEFQAIRLLKEAISRIEMGEVEAAGWRVADAGGYVYQAVTAKGKTSVMGVHGPTGLGNQVMNIFNTISSTVEG